MEGYQFLRKGLGAIAQVHNRMQTHSLTTARIARGWSQAHLAELVGVSTRTVVRWEAGQSLPYPIYREHLCRLLDLDCGALGLLPARDTTEQTERGKLAPASLPLPATPALYDPMIPEILRQSSYLQGRDDLLLQVKQRLLTGNEQTTTALQGLPGVGKTAIAVALANDAQVQAHFPDGILWADLGPQADMLRIFTRWGSLLECEGTDSNGSLSWSTWGKILHKRIGQQRMLLVIDDAWNIEAALALRVGGAQCVHLLTTRLPQVAFAFAQETTIALPELDEADSLALLTHFAPQVVEQEAEAALALVRTVGGLPLALNLLGKYLATQAFTGQPRRVKMAFSRLLERKHRLHVSLPTPLPRRPLGFSLSLYATMTLSVEQLSQEEQAVLVALALFPAKPHSFSEEAALAVSGGSVEQLDALWDAGLLESCGPGRYTLHQIIADYARELEIDHQVARQQSMTWLETAS